MPLLVLLLALCLSSCTGLPNTSGSIFGRSVPAEHPLIVVSLDGFHPDYLDRGLTPTLQQLADDGVRARWMIPAFPSKTFPNHYTLVTGLTPDHHGIVENSMNDPELGRFELKNRKVVQDGRWWGGEPLWVTARRHGLRASTLFWPGSEAAIGGVRPNDWLPFDAAMTNEARVDQVLAWLDRGERRRPHFITLYFDGIDTAGHLHGPDSPQTDAAMAAADTALRRLVDGLKTRGLENSINLVIVSDHGMAELLPDHVLELEDLVDPAWVRIVSLSEIASFEAREGFEAQVEAALLTPRNGINCYRKDRMPERWRYGSHPRVPSFVCQLHEGWRITRREPFNPWQAKAALRRGAHGFDPEAPSMRALFIAHGPAFKAGVLVDPFENVAVYPLLARLIGVAPLANDADPASSASLLDTILLPSATQRSEHP